MAGRVRRVGILLCKGIDLASGHIVFYTNERGRKGREMLTNPFAAAVFHWDALDRQVRIEGPIARSPAAESDAYFRSPLPWLSRIGAWVSDQSEPIRSRAALEEKLDRTLRRFGIDPKSPPPIETKMEIPRPPHWSGFRLYADRVELWCAGAGRLHDRAAWTRTLRAGGPGRESGVRRRPVGRHPPAALKDHSRRGPAGHPAGSRTQCNP